MYAELFPEQFIPDHVFVYIVKGSIQCHDGTSNQVLVPGDYYLFRKNHLVKYVRDKESNRTELIRMCLEERFLKIFQEKHQPELIQYKPQDSFVKLKKNKLLPDFIRSLKCIYQGGEIDESFADVKQEELLIILLRNQPELAGLLFDYGKPEKINLEAFMHRSYTFNLGIDQFAYLTGRSLSAFKRDFKAIFNQTPNRWLVQKRLQEAYFLLGKTDKKPSEIYLDLGFEAFSHFSFGFKKQFGLTPTELSERKQNVGR